jgi:hypothetical protein
MTNSSEQRLNKILRRARQNVFTDDSQYKVMLRVKALLMPIWDKRHCEIVNERMNKLLNVYFL